MTPQPWRRISPTSGASASAGSSGSRTPPAVVTVPRTSTRSFTATTGPSPDSLVREMKALRSRRSSILRRASSKFTELGYPLAALLNVEAHWGKVQIFTVYQLISAESQVRGRLQNALNDPAPYAVLHNVETTPLLPGAPRLQSIAEGYANKVNFGVVRMVDAEPALPDQTIELTKRFIYFQGTNFTVKGSVEFPSASDPKLHREMLFKAKFFPVVDSTLTVIGAEMAPLQWPHCYANRDLMVAVYLG